MPSNSSSPSASRRVRFVRKAALVLLGCALAAGGVAPAPPAVGQTPSRPNVLIFITDDQRAMDTMQVMPATRRWFGEGGTTFANGYAATPLCCPGRANVMTGRFAHNNGVRTNPDAKVMDQSTTLQAYLQGAGYFTAQVGKYLNAWPIEEEPPHFDHWMVLSPSPESYYGNTYNDNGVVAQKPGYSTDEIRDRAVNLIKTNMGPGSTDARPWLMYVNAFAPHHPWEPAARHATADVGTWPGNPAVFEEDKRDKPKYVQKSRASYDDALRIRESQLRSLMSVDEMVDAVFEALADENEQNTIAFFLSDNGFMWAEHGMRSKNHPYTESIRIPFLARWPGQIPAGQTDERFVANIDILPTVLQAAGVTPSPTAPPDGRSLLSPASRSKIFTEGWLIGRGPWASVRTPSYQYIEHFEKDGVTVHSREYYDLQADPWQLKNLYGDRRERNDPYAGALHRELVQLWGCAGQTGDRGCSRLLDQPGVPRYCGEPVRGHHLVGSEVRDRISGTKGRDIACGGGGNDRIKGQGGTDELDGDEGRDVLIGGEGNDVLRGRGGRDVCKGGGGKDKYRGCERKVERRRR